MVPAAVRAHRSAYLGCLPPCSLKRAMAVRDRGGVLVGCPPRRFRPRRRAKPVRRAYSGEPRSGSPSLRLTDVAATLTRTCPAPETAPERRRCAAHQAIHNGHGQPPSRAIPAPATAYTHPEECICGARWHQPARSAVRPMDPSTSPPSPKLISNLGPGIGVQLAGLRSARPCCGDRRTFTPAFPSGR